MQRIGNTVSPARLGSAVVVGAALVYAGVYGVRAAVVGGVAAPRCPAPPVTGQDIAAVFGRPSDYAQTARLEAAARDAGFHDAHYRLDPCGRLEVVVSRLPDVRVGHDIQREARSVGLRVTLERDN